jgi:hypothetical protein
VAHSFMPGSFSSENVLLLLGDASLGAELIIDF